MKIYQVGGFVRDLLRNVPPQDTDYVVVGATAKDLLRQGYLPVGKDFPVFINPKTKEEYALARREVKTGRRHSDFSFIFTPDITLLEDLGRRDFTCNALARDPQSGEIFDPFGGRRDIENRILRHVDSVHFPEDPLRLLRLCRFAAQLDFEVFPQTILLCQDMVKQNMLADLSPERLGSELKKALNFPTFYKFVETLCQIGAFERLFPDLDQPVRIDHLQRAADCSPLVKFALLYSRSNISSDLTATLYHRLRLPKRFGRFVCFVHQYQDLYQNAAENDIDRLFEPASALCHQDKAQLDDFIDYMSIACSCRFNTESVGRKAKLLRRIVQILSKISAVDMPNFETLVKSADFSARFRVYQLTQIKNFLSTHA
jgi:tRNA nucleotidyltransferase/poly(A) polymerase